MATAARDLGYAYVAICDHTPNVRVVPGGSMRTRSGARPTTSRRERAARAVPRPARRGGRHPLCGGLDSACACELDWVQLSLHAGQREQRDTLTTKVTDAMLHPAVRCLSHPDRAHPRPPAWRTRSTSRRRSRSRASTASRWRSMGSRPTRPLGTERQARDRGRRRGRRLHRRAFRSWSGQHATRRRHGQARLGDGGKRPQHTSDRGSPPPH